MTRSTTTRRGQALIEFAIVAFVLTLLLAGVLAFGLLLVSANVLQQAADVAAQELARHPFSATGGFEAALEDSQLFSEAALIIDPVPATQADLDQVLEAMPLVNRLLFPLYVFDPDADVLRYPGAVVTFTDPVTSGTFDTVLIPTVTTTAAGTESIDNWLRVVEEIRPAGQAAGPYSLSASAAETGSLSPGMVALRINYPHQSAALVGYVRVDGAGNVIPSTEVISTDVTNVAVTANDASLAAAALPAGYTLAPPTENAAFGASSVRGDYGLGEVLALGRAVRPFRKVLAAQGIYRREVLRP